MAPSEEGRLASTPNLLEHRVGLSGVTRTIASKFGVAGDREFAMDEPLPLSASMRPVWLGVVALSLTLGSGGLVGVVVVVVVVFVSLLAPAPACFLPAKTEA